MNRSFKILIVFLCIWQAAFATPRFLTISDIHYGSDNVAKDGHDTGNEFLKISLEEFTKLSNQVDFILLLGDLPTHSLFVTAKKEAFEKKVFHDLYVADHSIKPMFYITGNNDSLYGNYQPFELEGKSPLNFATEWTGSCAYCDGLMIDDSHMRREGYYSSYVIPGNKEIVLIALNSTQWAKMPIFSPQYPNQEQDAAIQMTWLEEQLQKLQAKQLLIAMHIPPGNSYVGRSFLKKRYTRQLIDLLNTYRSSFGQITLLTAHSHMDELRKIHLKGGDNIYIYSTPSISCNHHNNPGMKIFTLDKQMAIENYTTYYTSNLNSWGDEYYQALGVSNAIFPGCTGKNLSHCLNNLNDERVCHYLEEGFFYGVKNPRVPQNVCKITYKVN